MRSKTLSLRISPSQIFLLLFIVIGSALASVDGQGNRSVAASRQVAPAPPDNHSQRLAHPARPNAVLGSAPVAQGLDELRRAATTRRWAGPDGLPTAVGFDMQILGRATPTILNTAFNTIQMWDGRKANLEDQALGPIAAGGEMNLPLTEMVTRLQGIPGYVPEFDKAYPGQGISEVTVARAIASFERTVLSTESPFDRWRKGDEKAISAAARARLRAVHRQGQLRHLPPWATTSRTTASTTSA